ncbi:MAG: protein phosphatase 2C domain-containing protein [Myxococcales bacterium]|nr:protein phosphatase 2C domain-containing protein [Myxococcales bacterium]MDH3846139.1 protein phosphatase 2C domain-containing protein [Myxococcales bacterium]
MQYHSAGLTDVGQRRKLNEDAFLVDDVLGLYVVADGMGGHAAGEIASQEAVDTVHGMVRRGHSALDRVAQGDTSEASLRAAIRVVESAVQAATYMVFGLAQHDPDQQGMGTTVSVLAMCGDYGITAQVGDSRIYLVRGHQANSLTEDHTLVAWQLKQGIITESEAARSPHRNVITRAVGSREYVQVDTGFFEVQPSDCFLLCSDGLHGYLQEDEIPEIIDMGPKGATQRFVHIANSRGGRDNITAVVVSVH